MPCPHFSPQDSECLLVRGAAAVEDEEGGRVDADDPVDLAVCLAADTRYRKCPVYHSLVSELLP